MKHLFIAGLLLTSAVFAQEDRLIAILKSDAPQKDKSAACRELARVGTRQAVPVLAPLLADETYSHMARYALEPIPDPSVDAALRDALGKLKGRSLAGVITSLGTRRDTAAVEPLTKLLTDADPTVAQAAARALGDIGGSAVRVLGEVLPVVPPTSRFAVCEGLLRCAGSLPDTDAAAIYDRLLSTPDLPYHVRVAALAGAARARRADSVPLLVEALRAESRVEAADVIRMLADIPGAEVTRVLTNELDRSNMDTQILLLQALGNRGDTSAVPALLPLTRNGSVARRIAAIRSLVQLGDSSAIPTLVALVSDPETAMSRAALAGLVGFPGNEADAAVVRLLNTTNSRLRIAVIDAAAQRRTAAAVPVLLKATGDPDAAVASAGFQALSELGEAADIPAVVDALMHTKAVPAAETALSAICARQSETAVCTEALLAGLKKAKGEPKLSLLRVLSTTGDAQALAAIRDAAGDSDPSVKETALRALCEWPSADALPDLMRLTGTTADTRFKILALRGQLRLIPAQNVAEAQKVSQLKEVLPLIDRQEEKHLALAALGNLPCAEALALVVPYLTSEGLKEEASDAAISIAERIVDRHPAEVGNAMKRVHTNNRKLAERVQQLLARLPADTAEEGFAPIFNGKDLSGWSGKPGWWTVEDGALTAESTADKPCKECNYLIWRGGQPADFELLADFKLSRDGNSGIQIRSEQRPDWDTFGYQADMTGNGELVGFVYHHSRGLIAGRGEKAVFAADGTKTADRIGDPTELLMHFKQGDWNTYRIVCRGPDITLHVNGILMCQITDHHATQAPTRGIIALQMHPGPPMKVQFKNLRLKMLN